MRKAAIAAGTVQLLSGIFTVAPQIFGTSFSSAPGQTAFRIFSVVACLVLAIFFFAIVITPAPRVSGAIRVASVVAVAALAVENLVSTYHNIQRTIAAASESGLWKYHPLSQFAHILGLAIPTLAEITMVVFFLVVCAGSPKAPDRKRGGLVDRTRFLKFASFIVAAMFSIALVVTFSSVILAPHPVTVSAVRLLLRFATLSSFIAFYVVFGINQGRHEAADTSHRRHTQAGY